MPDPFNSPNEKIIREKVPVFSPTRIISVTAGVEWVPETNDKAFYSSVDTTFTIGPDWSSGGTYILLSAENVLGIAPSVTFTFSTNVDLAVMS